MPSSAENANIWLTFFNMMTEYWLRSVLPFLWTLTSFSKWFRFILKESKMTFLLPEPRKKANYVCGTINPRRLLPFSLFCLCSADSYDSTAYIVQKFLTLIARLGSQFELKIRFILSPGIASDTMHDFAYCILLLFYLLRSALNAN